jgi:hypothetical protein
VELHGGTIEVAPSTRGALIRVDLPADPRADGRPGGTDAGRNAGGANRR